MTVCQHTRNLRITFAEVCDDCGEVLAAEKDFLLLADPGKRKASVRPEFPGYIGYIRAKAKYGSREGKIEVRLNGENIIRSHHVIAADEEAGRVVVLNRDRHKDGEPIYCELYGTVEIVLPDEVAA